MGSTSSKLIKKQPIFRYTLGKQIGEGANGKVFESLNIETGETLACKSVPLSDDRRTAIAQVQELKQEILVLKALNHKNIVQYFTTEVSMDNREVNIFMEYMKGGSVRSLLNQCRHLPEKVVKVYIKQILEGLSYLHAKRIIHRDLKCANLLLSSEGVIKISDFGSSKILEDQLYSSLKGSPYWMAPEVAKRNSCSFSADVWSLGCVCLEMLTGNAPWAEISSDSATVIEHLRNTTDPPIIPKTLSYLCTHFLEVCLRIHPQNRPSVDELLRHDFLLDRNEAKPFSSVNVNTQNCSGQPGKQKRRIYYMM